MNHCLARDIAIAEPEDLTVPAIAINAIERWSRDATEEIADALAEQASVERLESVSAGSRDN